MKTGYVWKKVMSGKEVITMLQNNGWVTNRIKGDHYQMMKNGFLCPVPYHKELKKGTLHNIKKIVELAESFNK